MEYPYLFLSSSIESKPASCIGAFGLSITCALVPLTAFIRHARVKWAANQLTSEEDKLVARQKNTFALKVVVVAAVGGLGVASFPSVEDNCGGTSGQPLSSSSHLLELIN